MILLHKNVGETPLELIDRLRAERPELQDETLSYAGRLDPMAEGHMLILVGEEENKNREAYMGFDKEYVVTFLIGVATDTGDVLGMIQDTSVQTLSVQALTEIISSCTNITSQTYPWFSSKTVHGKKLFEHFKAGNPDKITRPTRDVCIYASEVLAYTDTHAVEDIQRYIVQSIQRVHGDFRQVEILDGWEQYFATLKKSCGDSQCTMTTVDVRLHVSSGTYIRALTEVFPIPTVLLKLNRTNIFV